MNTEHTIVLMQSGKQPNSRTYSDYESTILALEGIIRIYESKLKQLNPNVRDITYDVQDLHAYIDHLEDLCCLIFEPSKKAYLPRDKVWIKSKLMAHLKRAAGL